MMSAGVLRPLSHRITSEAFYRAVVAAGRAPSAYDRKPWRWQMGDGVLDLFTDPTRMSGLPDPDGRLVTISCGAALHHARVTLAARGWQVTVTRLPEAADPAHLARLHIDGAAPVSPATADLARRIKQRHTDVHPITGDPIDPETLQAIGTAFGSQHVRLEVLRPDQILALTVASVHVPVLDSTDAQWHGELALWTGSDRIAAADDDLRQPIVHGDHDRAATLAVLYGSSDHMIDWLHAGEALSTGSLVATSLGVSVLPLSAPVEHADARQALRRTAPEVRFPYLMLRLGRYATGTAAPPSSLQPAGETTGP
ncbi:nitroreductase [Actinoplanes sp. NPDC024001]|uniref:nitroreductase n=1 Tax=Actinoplanes sp. NPDC024001 TaxID=3154598 RepID=UPI0033DC3572